ncbi:colicin import protein TolA [Sodalis glossinidius str. 'morsitans']|uniref:Colicin import protein TolA n=1 Tax=Sodalis glossinidius (strain morsitans) TaxID=343509 RepID=Q2NUL5_SODGM|nr:cell envelope integrity protein TolA [Sodalis glossinidius]BAE74160.1 colicin import protein TolA [Sodalis glossinidius str. 'morsitans']
MLKATEQNDKLKRAIILSIALHCVLIAVLIWSSIHQPQETSAGGGGGSSIDAVMVDPGAVVQQYNRQQQQQIDAQRAQQQRLKALEKQRLDAQEAAEAQQRQQAEQQKQAEEAAKQAEAAAAQAEAEAAAAAKQQAEAEVKKAAAAEAQKQADAKAKQAAAKKATAAKQSSEVDDLLGGLTDAKNAPKSGGAPAAGTSNSKLSGATGLEINGYLAQVRQAISNKFYDASNYSGKTCILRIKLAPDGMLISVSPDGGDPALCQAAVSAAKLAAIPRPPSPKVYEAVKNATLDFKP